MSDLTGLKWWGTIAEEWRREQAMLAEGTSVDQLEGPSLRKPLPPDHRYAYRPDPGATKRRRQRKLERQERKRGRGERG